MTGTVAVSGRASHDDRHTLAVPWSISGFPSNRAAAVAPTTRDTMRHTTLHHRLPRAGIDVIDDSATAFAMLSMSIHRPLRHETILLLLDQARRGRAIVVVADTVAADSAIEVVECITHANAGDGLAGIVVASVRPDDTGLPDVDAADIDRWMEMSDLSDAVGVELLEWFVIGRSVRCPRDRLGEPPRW